MPDLMDDPRVAGLTFGALKRFLRGSVIPKAELDTAGTKFALLHQAEKWNVELERLFEDLQADPKKVTALPTPQAPPAPKHHTPTRPSKTGNGTHRNGASSHRASASATPDRTAPPTTGAEKRAAARKVATDKATVDRAAADAKA